MVQNLHMLQSVSLQQISELLDVKLAPIRETLDEHSRILQSHSETLQSHGEKLQSHSSMHDSHFRQFKTLNRLVKSLKKDQGIMLDLLDREQMRLRRQIDRVEDHLKLGEML